jgi:GNAT superfamily N-acetyltransferase
VESDPIRVRREPLDGPIAYQLILELDAELTERYPEEGATHFRLDPAEVAPGMGAFLVAYAAAGDDQPLGCGAIRRLDARVGEVKRMYTRAAARGRRVATRVLAALEDEARALGLARLILETGVRQPEAIRVYTRAGYTPIDPWGEYVDSPLSLCMGKDL